MKILYFTVIDYLVPWPRDARESVIHFIGKPMLHQPITVACQQQSGQKDGEFGLVGQGPNMGDKVKTRHIFLV